MIPVGKQQEVFHDLSASSPEELSGNCGETGRLFIEGGGGGITNEKSALVYRRPCIASLRQSDPA
jgi:hypothetical protein